MDTTSFFTWTLEDGSVVHSDEPPTEDMPVIELILRRDEQRLKEEGLRLNMSFPIHERAMRQRLPESLYILRISGCRIRTFPTLPPNMIEFYADACDFFTLPDLSHLEDLLVMSFKNNRIEYITNPLPPNIVSMNLENNALIRITGTKPETLDVKNVNVIGNPNLQQVWGQTYEHRSTYTAHRNIHDHTYRHVTTPRPIHEDRQNVHDPGVQKSARTNFDVICKYKLKEIPLRKNIVDIISSDMKRVYSKHWLHRLWMHVNPSHYNMLSELKSRISSPYSMHGYSLTHIIDRLWLRIMDLPKETRKDCIQRFVEEVEDSYGMCANGFATRMQNVLIGFDENVVVKLDPSVVIQSRIPATMNRIRKEKKYTEGEEPIDFWVDVINATMNDMDDINMDIGQRFIWLYPLLDSIIDHKKTINNTTSMNDYIKTIGIVDTPAMRMVLGSHLQEL